jgi:hypothetical protein
MKVSRHAGTMIKGAVIWTGLVVAVLCIALAATGFFAAAFFVWMADHLGAAAAAAVTGSALLVLGVVIAFVGGALLRSLRRRQPSLLSELGGTVGLVTRLVAMMVRRDPKKAMIISLVAGALAEYITTERKR